MLLRSADFYRFRISNAMLFGLRTWINVCKCLVVILVMLGQCGIQFLAVHEAGLFRLDKVIVAAITTTH